jgi:trk system potassium uptake protein TrkA
MLADDHVMVDLRATGTILGKTLKELDLRVRFRINIVALKHLMPSVGEDGQNRFVEIIDDVPAPDAILREGDVLMVVGRTRQVELAIKEFAE